MSLNKGTGWLKTALRLAREGDTEAELRQQLFQRQLEQSMDANAAETKRKVEEDRQRGLFARIRGNT